MLDARAESIDCLPSGRAVALLECEDELVLAFAKDHISEQARAEVTDILQQLAASGRLSLYRGGSPEPPQQLSA